MSRKVKVRKMPVQLEQDISYKISMYLISFIYEKYLPDKCRGDIEVVRKFLKSIEISNSINGFNENLVKGMSNFWKDEIKKDLLVTSINTARERTPKEADYIFEYYVKVFLTHAKIKLSKDVVKEQVSQIVKLLWSNKPSRIKQYLIEQHKEIDEEIIENVYKELKNNFAFLKTIYIFWDTINKEETR